MVLHLAKFENVFGEAEPTYTSNTSRSEIFNQGTVDILDQRIYNCEVTLCTVAQSASIGSTHSCLQKNFANQKCLQYFVAVVVFFRAMPATG